MSSRCKCVRVQVCVRACANTWRPEYNIRCFPQFPLYFLNQGLSLNLKQAQLKKQAVLDLVVLPFRLYRGF